MNIIDLSNLLRKFILCGFNVIKRIISPALDKIIKLISFDFLTSSIIVQASLRGVNHWIILPIVILAIDMVISGAVLSICLFCLYNGCFFVGSEEIKMNSRSEYKEVSMIDSKRNR